MMTDTTQSKSKITLHLEDVRELQGTAMIQGNRFIIGVSYADIQTLLTLEALRTFLVKREIAVPFEVSPDLLDTKYQLLKKEEKGGLGE